MGCGHTMINKALAGAFELMEIKPTKVNLITDIGCVGLVDKMFLTNTIHTTHGRSTAFATGIELADKVLFENDAKNVIMIGDGGATIGLLHLVEAAKLNTDITVVLHNNFVYGMTGGQNSGLTPENFKTATTMSGSISPNIHIAKLLEASHANYISRKLATDKDLAEALRDAINHPGFSLVEIVELCTGYATKWNSMTKKDIEEILVYSDSEERGTIVKNNRESYAQTYTQAFNKNDNDYKTQALEVKQNSKELNLKLVLAGSAGEGIQFTSKLFAKSLVKEGLYINQKNDNPVTIGTGFSLAELKISNEEILYSAIDRPDFFLISSIDGYQRVKGWLGKSKESKIIADSSLKEQIDNDFKESLNINYFDARENNKDKRLAAFSLLGAMYRALEADLRAETIISEIESQKINPDAISKAFGLYLNDNH